METPIEKAQNERFPGRDERRPAEKQQNIQDAFLNSARRDKTLLIIHLSGGMKLTGRIRSFDKYSIVLESNNQEQLVFKHAISIITTSRPGGSPAPAPGVNAPIDPRQSKAGAPGEPKRHQEG